MPLGLREMVEHALANVEAVSARAVREGLDSGEVDLLVVTLRRGGAGRLLQR